MEATHPLSVESAGLIAWYPASAAEVGSPITAGECPATAGTVAFTTPASPAAGVATSRTAAGSTIVLVPAAADPSSEFGACPTRSATGAVMPATVSLIGAVAPATVSLIGDVAPVTVSVIGAVAPETVSLIGAPSPVTASVTGAVALETVSLTGAVAPETVSLIGAAATPSRVRR